MKKNKKKRLFFTIAIIIIAFIIGFVLESQIYYTPKIRNENGKVIQGSIATLEKIEIGGINQYIQIRGENENNPILLFLHGGPGYPQISFARKFQTELEKDFVVVQWDQRGSGKTYNRKTDQKTMTREQFELDTIELVYYLRDRGGKEKIFLAGHSWGSDLGLHVASKRPELFHAFIGIGQVVDKIRQEEISYDYVMAKAKADNNKKAIRELEEIGYPPYANHEKDVMVQRKWLKEYGGVERNVDTLKEIITGIFISPEYTWLDGIRFLRGNYLTRRTMFETTKHLNILDDIPEVEIPIYFMAGRYDYNTPSELVKEYYNNLTAPKKEFFWFENSAHDPHFEEVDRFASIMKYILEETIK